MNSKTMYHILASSGNSSVEDGASSHGGEEELFRPIVQHYKKFPEFITMSLVVIAAVLFIDSLILVLQKLTDDTPFIKLVHLIEKELMIVGFTSFLFKIFIYESGDLLTADQKHALEFADVLIPMFSLCNCLLGLVLVYLTNRQTHLWTRACSLKLEELLDHHFGEQSRWQVALCGGYRLDLSYFSPTNSHIDFRLHHLLFCELFKLHRRGFQFDAYCNSMLEAYVFGVLQLSPFNWLLYAAVLVFDYYFFYQLAVLHGVYYPRNTATAYETYCSGNDVSSGAAAANSSSRSLFTTSLNTLFRRLESTSSSGSGVDSAGCSEQRAAVSFIIVGVVMIGIMLIYAVVAQWYQTALFRTKGITTHRAHPAYLMYLEHYQQQIERSSGHTRTMHKDDLKKTMKRPTPNSMLPSTPKPTNITSYKNNHNKHSDSSSRRAGFNVSASMSDITHRIAANYDNTNDNDTNDDNDDSDSSSSSSSNNDNDRQMRSNTINRGKETITTTTKHDNFDQLLRVAQTEARVASTLLVQFYNFLFRTEGSYANELLNIVECIGAHSTIQQIDYASVVMQVQRFIAVYPEHSVEARKVNNLFQSVAELPLYLSSNTQTRASTSRDIEAAEGTLDQFGQRVFNVQSDTRSFRSPPSPAAVAHARARNLRNLMSIKRAKENVGASASSISTTNNNCSSNSSIIFNNNNNNKHDIINDNVIISDRNTSKVFSKDNLNDLDSIVVNDHIADNSSATLPTRKQRLAVTYEQLHDDDVDSRMYGGIGKRRSERHGCSSSGSNNAEDINQRGIALAQRPKQPTLMRPSPATISAPATISSPATISAPATVLDIPNTKMVAPVRIFLCSSPSLFLHSAQYLLMLVAIYSALWLIYIPMAMHVNGLYKFLSFLPIIVSFMLCAFVLLRAALLQATLYLNKEVMLEVIESEESAKLLGATIRKQLILRLQQIIDDEHRRDRRRIRRRLYAAANNVSASGVAGLGVGADALNADGDLDRGRDTAARANGQHDVRDETKAWHGRVLRGVKQYLHDSSESNSAVEYSHTKGTSMHDISSSMDEPLHAVIERELKQHLQFDALIDGGLESQQDAVDHRHTDTESSISTKSNHNHDINATSTATNAEIEQYLQQLDAQVAVRKANASEEIHKLFHEIDFDGDGSLSRREFEAFLRSLDLVFSRKRWLQIFRRIDRHNDDKISLEEFTLFLYPTHGRTLQREKSRLSRIKRRVTQQLQASHVFHDGARIDDGYQQKQNFEEAKID